VDREMINGITVASAAETLLAVARDLGVLDLVILADSALHQGACTVDQLSTAAAERRHGAPRLRTVIPFARRAKRVAVGVCPATAASAADVEVEPQKKIYDDWGRFVARADLWVVGTRRLHEYDREVHRDREHIVRIWHVSGASWRSTGSASDLPHPSWSTKEAQYSRA
jgi:hypothetical protein